LILLTITQLIACAGCTSMFDPARIQALGQSVARIAIYDSTGSKLGAGTAWALNENYTVTAKHVCDIKGRAEIRGMVVIPVYRSASSDICIMRGNPKLKPLLIASSGLSEGDILTIFGFPRGAPRVFTWGFAGPIVIFPHGEFRQLSAPSNPGNSGSPVLNRNGRVVGILVAGLPVYPHVSYSVTYDQLKKAASYVR